MHTPGSHLVFEMSDDAQPLAGRMSPGFVVDMVGSLSRVPLRALTHWRKQRSGEYALSLSTCVSGHLGEEAAYTAIVQRFGPRSTPLDPSFLDDGPCSTHWCDVSVPAQRRRYQRLAENVVAVHAVRGAAVAQAMVDAGLAKWRLDLEPETDTAGRCASMLELLALTTRWTKPSKCDKASDDWANLMSFFDGPPNNHAADRDDQEDDIPEIEENYQYDDDDSDDDDDMSVVD